MSTTAADPTGTGPSVGEPTEAPPAPPPTRPRWDAVR